MYLEGLQRNQSGHMHCYYDGPDIENGGRLLIWPQAPAFALSSKNWMTISLGHVERIEPSEDSIKNLQLDPAAVQVIKALSMQQDQSSDSWGADFIEGKGAGQIILLHGPPGVGKTYTVEGISEWLRRPLISLTVADIGTTETRVEQELTKWFDLAEAWNAVLLVDEADIFLEQRKNRDLSRNGLVSASLRRMEYFRGLLFLTTNRVGQIDDAFVSRVHMAIGYERLSPGFRRNIWEGFFRKLERERAGRILVGPSAKKFVLHSDEVQKIELNGREIRNALQTAITLAEFESIEAAGASGQNGTTSATSQLVIVEEDHFRRVLKMSEKFHDYVTGIRREDEIQRAKVRGDRDDYAKVGAADGQSK
ncbi:hypothetical protein KC354_g7462 [Hortaea werneckii]|nr:hypothetical protein KC354_g7462 [Hortaea werneckii]